MNRRIIVGFIALICVIVVSICIAIFMRRRASFEDYQNSTDQHYTIVDDGNVYLYGDADYEETNVANLAAAYGYIGGITKMLLDDVGEGIIPDIASEYGAKYWYIITTSNGVHYAVVIDGDIVID